MPRARTKPLRAEQFTSAKAVQPWWYRAVNRLGRILPRLKAPTAEAWFDEAQKRTGIDVDPRPETLAALDALLASIRDDAAVSFSGGIAAKMDSLRMAAQHLRIEKALRDDPAIEATGLPPPIFLIGWMRTGTTFAHRLLAQDPETRTMPYWESMFPVPPESGEDSRPDDLEHVLGQLAAISPSYEAIHPMGAHEPEECVALFTNIFRTLQYNVQYCVPGYVEWLRAEDPRVAYGQYKQQLQLVHRHRPHGKRFALKDPTHSVFVDTILELFPNARFVFTHRDPAETVSSMCSLYAYTRALFSDDVDPHALGPAIMESYLPASLERALERVDQLPLGRVAHVRAPELFTEPIAVMEQAYRDLGLDFTEGARRGMQTLLDEDARKPNDVHLHSPAGFGLSRDGIRDRLADYCARFDL